MAKITIVLTENELQDIDVSAIIGLHPEERHDYVVLVPADTERNLIVDIIDSLALIEFHQVLDDVLGREPDPETARMTAKNALTASLEALREADRCAEGSVVADDPLPALRQAVVNHDAVEAVVVTRPHMLEDTFNRDWASRARADLGVPVLHLYAGMGRVG